MTKVGYKPTKEHKRNISLALTGRKLSKGWKRKISLAHLGKKMPPFSKEWRKNLSESHIKRRLPKNLNLIKNNISYVLGVLYGDGYNLSLFRKLIKFSIKRKENKLDEILKLKANI